MLCLVIVFTPWLLRHRVIDRPSMEVQVRCVTNCYTVVNCILLFETITETTEDKLTYKSYSENEIDLYNTIGPRLSNQERTILKKCKNINE